MDNSFSIQFVAKVTGLNAHTLRAWEKRYQSVVPDRTEKGKRLYCQDDIDRLKKLISLTNLGNSISDVSKLKNEELDELLQQYGVTTTDNSDAFEDKIAEDEDPVDINNVLQSIIMALKFYKLDIISHELNKIKGRIDGRDFALNILAPLLAEVGTLVSKGVITIAQEHSLSAILKFHTGHLLFKYYDQPERSNMDIAIAAPEGELHEFGIMIAALLCSHYNLNFYYLGANMPAESLAEAANQVGSQIVILGVSQVYEESKFESYVSLLKEELGEDVNLWLGGVGHTSSFLDQNNIDIIPTLSMLDYKLASSVTR